MHVHVVRTSSCTLLLSVARFTLHADCDLAAVVESCPLNMTGADFYALCSDAMLNALKTQVELLQQGAYAAEQLPRYKDAQFRVSPSSQASNLTQVPRLMTHVWW